MINKLIENRFLILPGFDQSPPPADTTFPDHFVRAIGRTYNIEESESSGTFYTKKTSQIGPGPHATKEHRTFRWLPWVLGKVSCVPLAGPDILTGLMTGCWLVVFQYKGVPYAGHIGTDTSPTAPNTVQARAAWRNAVVGKQVTPVAAYNPVGSTLPAVGALNTKGEAAEFYGAISGSGETYTVVLTAPGHGGTTRRIAKVVKMATTQDVTAF